MSVPVMTAPVMSAPVASMEMDPPLDWTSIIRAIMVYVFDWN